MKDRSSEEDILNELLDLYPEAIGLRSHSLYVHSKLRSIYAKRGIQYESNYMMYRVNDIKPFIMLPDVIQFPIYFMDDEWFRRQKKENKQPPSAKKFFEPSGLKVFDFHPPHIAFNTPTTEYYQRHKEEYWSNTTDIERIRYEGFGVRDLFKSLLEEIERANHETALLSTLGQEYREAEGLA